MKIDINLYIKYNAVLPGIGVIIIAIFSVVDAVLLYKNRGTSSMHFYIFSLLVSVVVLINMAFQFRHGFSLIFDRDQSTCTVSGEVEDVTFAEMSPRFYINNKACRAVWIHIDGQKYYVIDTDEISAGDYVEIVYLQKNLFVIEYTKESCDET